MVLKGEKIYIRSEEVEFWNYLLKEFMSYFLSNIF